MSLSFQTIPPEEHTDMPLLEELQSRQFWRSLMAEILASLLLVSAVLGSSISSQGPLCPALAAGMATVALSYCFGEISGAQVNPAVTLALVVMRRLDLLRGSLYMLGQCVGATGAAAILYVLLPVKSSAEYYVSKVPSEGNAGQALAIEMLATFQLVFTIFSVEEKRNHEGSDPGHLAVGFSLSAGALAASHVSGGSLNPARSLGPAIITGFWEHHWVYWIGPSVGALMAGASHEFFFAANASRQKLVACLKCKDTEITEMTSTSHSSLSTVTQAAARAKIHKHEHS